MPKNNNSELLILKEISSIPLIAMIICILKYWGLIYENNWGRRYFALSTTTVFNLTQFIFIFTTNESVQVVIRNAYILVSWFNTITRGYLLVLQRFEYEQFLSEFVHLYLSLLKTEDIVVRNMLKEANALGKKMTTVNMILGHLTVFGFCSYPLFVDEKMLPYGSHVPGINELETPFFEIFYAYQVFITPIGCWLYIPFGCLVVSLIMFATLMCKVLQYRLREINEANCVPKIRIAKIIWCIKYQKKIIEYVEILNKLTTYVFLVEFLSFGGLLCALLFLMNIAETTAQITIAIIQTSMIFSQVFTLYWFASQLTEESGKVAQAAYNTNWFMFDIPEQKNIMMMIMRAQKPCVMTVGNVYPMSLEMFQSLMNTSYSYYTILRRFYG